jgi:hypothetical protein
MTACLDPQWPHIAALFNVDTMIAYLAYARTGIVGWFRNYVDDMTMERQSRCLLCDDEWISVTMHEHRPTHVPLASDLIARDVLPLTRDRAERLTTVCSSPYIDTVLETHLGATCVPSVLAAVLSLGFLAPSLQNVLDRVSYDVDFRDAMTAALHIPQGALRLIDHQVGGVVLCGSDLWYRAPAQVGAS